MILVISALIDQTVINGNQRGIQYIKRKIVKVKHCLIVNEIRRNKEKVKNKKDI